MAAQIVKCICFFQTKIVFFKIELTESSLGLHAPSSKVYSHKLPLSDLLDRPSPSYQLRNYPLVPRYDSSESLTPYKRRDPIASSYNSSVDEQLMEYEYGPRRYRSPSPSFDIERYAPSRFRSVLGTSSELQRVLPYLTTKLRDTRIELAQPAQLKCQALGGRPSNIKWFKNGREIKQDGRLTLWNANDMSVLEISRATLMDTGLYRAEVHNGIGTTSYYCMLRVTRRITSLLYKDLPLNSDPEYTFKEGEVIRVINRLPPHLSDGKLFLLLCLALLTIFSPRLGLLSQWNSHQYTWSRLNNSRSIWFSKADHL